MYKHTDKGDRNIPKQGQATGSKKNAKSIISLASLLMEQEFLSASRSSQKLYTLAMEILKPQWTIV